MGREYCYACLLPTEAKQCECGQLRPDMGWPQDILLDTVVDGRFHVIRRIGVGGTSIVYLAHPRHRAAPVALKTMLPDPTGFGWHRRLIREAEILGYLQGKFIVRMKDRGYLEDGRLFLVLEYIDGTALATVIERRGALSAQTSVFITLQVATAMSRAHAQGVIHRDLKPANVLLLAGGRLDQVKLLDFGIACRLDHSDELTRDGQLVGTPRYMAPEQIRRPAELDIRTDIFGLGMVLFELLTGELPYPVEDTLPLLARRIQDRPWSLKDLCPERHFPLSLHQTVRRMLEPEPMGRFQSMQDVESALYVVLEDLRQEKIAQIRHDSAPFPVF